MQGLTYFTCFFIQVAIHDNETTGNLNGKTQPTLGKILSPFCGPRDGYSFSEN
jgi:hypothetical protein